MFPRLPSIRLYSIQRQYGWLPKAGTKPCQFRPICQNITLTVRHYCSPPRKFNPVTSANDQIRNSRWKNFWKKFDDFFEPKHVSSAQRNKNFLIHCSAFCILFFGVTYGSVPLYRIFCQANALGGEIRKGHDSSKVATMQSNKERLLTVRFEADTSASMQWNFRPQQKEVKLYAGETALAFYSAKNATSKPIDGISTYNVIPYAAGLYFNKIQCFCFEEQRLNPNEEVDMPVFFYIDPDYLEDPDLENENEIILSYTFFESKPGLSLKLPNQSVTK